MIPFPNLLEQFLQKHPDESTLVNQYLERYKDSDAFYRTARPGHFTASALVMTPKKDKVLLVEHKKLGFWVQPGGHADGSEDLDNAARREVEEETGVFQLSGDGTILDLDIHAIPPRPGESGHDHYDVRFLYIADSEANLIISEESTNIGWIPITNIKEYSTDASLLRLVHRGLQSLS
ncbi:MAG: NUDIX hydrolase [Spirochaetales bacterium]|nr:NUDIX hydrolase [Spirochaetales bacterium]